MQETTLEVILKTKQNKTKQNKNKKNPKKTNEQTKSTKNYQAIRKIQIVKLKYQTQ